MNQATTVFAAINAANQVIQGDVNIEQAKKTEATAKAGDAAVVLDDIRSKKSEVDGIVRAKEESETAAQNTGQLFAKFNDAYTTLNSKKAQVDQLASAIGSASATASNATENLAALTKLRGDASELVAKMTEYQKSIAQATGVSQADKASSVQTLRDATAVAAAIVEAANKSTAVATSLRDAETCKTDGSYYTGGACDGARNAYGNCKNGGTYDSVTRQCTCQAGKMEINGTCTESSTDSPNPKSSTDSPNPKSSTDPPKPKSSNSTMVIVGISVAVLIVLIVLLFMLRR